MTQYKLYLPPELIESATEALERFSESCSVSIIALERLKNVRIDKQFFNAKEAKTKTPKHYQRKHSNPYKQ